MTSATSVEYAIPANWQDFERLSRALLSKVYERPFQRWGRSGQRQDGVDIWATLPDGRIIAAQCKGRSQNFGKPLSVADLNAAVRATASFPHPIDELIVLTTAADDCALQSHATSLTLDRARHNQSRVNVWGWGTISEHIGMHASVQKAFYGHWFARVSFSQRLALIGATIALLTIGAAGLFLFHEKRVGLSHSRAVTVKELQRLTALIDDLGGAYGVCTRAMAKEMFVFTAQLNKSCLDPIQVQLNAFDKQLQTSMPFSML